MPWVQPMPRTNNAQFFCRKKFSLFNILNRIADGEELKEVNSFGEVRVVGSGNVDGSGSLKDRGIGGVGEIVWNFWEEIAKGGKSIRQCSGWDVGPRVVEVKRDLNVVAVADIK